MKGSHTTAFGVHICLYMSNKLTHPILALYRSSSLNRSSHLVSSTACFQLFQAMAEDSRGRSNEPARDIGLGVSMGSSGKRFSGGRTRSIVDAAKLEMFEAVRDMARARKEAIVRRSQQEMAAKSTHPINRAMDLLDELQGEISDEIYVAAAIALTDEQFQYVFVRINKERRRLWLSKLKPLQ